MIQEIKKHDQLICKKTFKQKGVTLFKENELYISSQDHCLVDINGEEQCCFTNTDLNNHFELLSINPNENK